MADAESRARDLHLVFPPARESIGIYKTAVRVGNLLYTSGHLPFRSDKTIIVGRVGEDLTLEQGKEAARQVGVSILTTLRQNLGSLNKVKRLIKTLAWVNCTADFRDQPSVVNGFSQLMKDVFGEDLGVGVRSAVSAHTLPVGAAVEIECVFEVEE